MSTLHFPYRPRDDDPRAAMVVQRNLDYLADKVRDLGALFDSGTVVILPGNTTGDVTFAATIPNPAVSASPTVNLGTGWWLSSVGPGGFTVNLASPAPVGGVSFSWVAIGKKA